MSDADPTTNPPPTAPARIGIDIGGTSVKAIWISASSSLTAKSEAYENPPAEMLVDAIAQCVRGWGTLTEDALKAAVVGLCIPGIYDPATDRLVRSVNLPRVQGAVIGELLGRALGRTDGRSVRAAVVSDALAATVDLARSQRLRGRVMGICIGTGVGMAVIDDGRPLVVAAPGRGNSSGHLGQVDVAGDDPTPPEASDGARGTLESYIGLPALRRRYAVAHVQVVESLLAENAAGATLARPLAALVRAMRIAHAIYRPDHIRLLGGIGIRLGSVLPRLHHAVDDGLTGLAIDGWSLGVGSSDWHAARGAAELACGPIPENGLI